MRRGRAGVFVKIIIFLLSIFVSIIVEFIYFKITLIFFFFYAYDMLFNLLKKNR